MTTIDQSIQRFRKEFAMDKRYFGGRYIREATRVIEVENFLRQELTDFAREVESKVIGKDIELQGRFDLSSKQWYLDREVNNQKAKQRQALHQLIGEEGQK